MTCHGICLRQGLLMPEKEEKGRKTEPERRRMGWWMRHIMQYVFKKGFFLPSCRPPPPFFLMWLSTPVYSRSVALEKNSPAHPMLPLEIVCSLWEREKGKGKWKGRMHFRAWWSGQSGKRKTEGDPPVTFLITLKSPHWVMRFTVLLLVLRGLPCMFLCVDVYSRHALGRWFTGSRSSCCGELCPIRLSVCTHVKCPSRTHIELDFKA